MNELKATEAKLNCLRMVQGTSLSWKDCVRIKDTKHAIHRTNLDDYEADSLEFAIGIVESRPVWRGDVLYYQPHSANRGVPFTAYEHNLVIVRKHYGEPSWNPPTPKTVMVELLIEDADSFGNLPTWQTEDCVCRIAVACRKALEGMKPNDPDSSPNP